MEISCYVIDDEYHAVDILKTFIEKTPGLFLAGSATNPLDGLNDLTGTRTAALTFIDIDMPELSGIELAGMLSTVTKVIFTTSYREYAVEAFEKEAIDYLLKPISYERFLKAINAYRKNFIVKEKVREVTEPYFFITSEVKGRMIKIMTNNIVYIEASLNYIKIYSNEGMQMAYLTMEEAANYLPARQFVRIHRSYFINVQFVKSVEPGQITLVNKKTLPLGDTYKKEFIGMMNVCYGDVDHLIPGQTDQAIS